MDRVTRYQNIIIPLLEENARYYKGSTNPLDIKVIADFTNHQYLLIMYGWNDQDYIHQILLHLEIRQEKIWIHLNDTSIPIEQELVQAGISPTVIVLGLKHPDYRIYTDFATI